MAKTDKISRDELLELLGYSYTVAGDKPKVRDARYRELFEKYEGEAKE